MSIDIRSEELVRISDVPKLNNLPRRPGSKQLHIATIYRWAQRGLKGIKLETLKVGGTTCTSIEALQRFFDALTEPRETGEVDITYVGLKSNNHRTRQRWSAKRLREIEEAERRLKEAGI